MQGEARIQPGRWHHLPDEKGAGSGTAIAPLRLETRGALARAGLNRDTSQPSLKTDRRTKTHRQSAGCDSHGRNAVAMSDGPHAPLEPPEPPPDLLRRPCATGSAEAGRVRTLLRQQGKTSFESKKSLIEL
eukprot:2892039-Rhodomonas_salina.5